MNARSPVDLHLHSTASDGMLDPAALVAHVAGCGVRLMALTDHDTVAGIEAIAVTEGPGLCASSAAARTGAVRSTPSSVASGRTSSSKSAVH